MEISNDGSSKSKSKSKTKSVVMDINSDNISMSDLELLANKKKVNKQELLVSDIVSDKNVSDKNVSDKNVSENSDKKVSEKKNSRKPKDRMYGTTISNSDTTLNTTAYQKEKQRKINKENKNEKIRFQKNDYLYKISQLNQRGNVSQLKLDMNCSLEEIEKEYNRIKNNKQAEVMVGLCKKGLLLGVQGFEFLNNKFDPLGIDLDGWGESMSYSMENQDYDEVLRELYEKYKGKETWSPEARLVMLILGSAVMFSVTKKMSNMDMSSNSFLGNIMNNFMNKQQPQQQPPQQFQVPKFQHPQQPQFQQPQFQQPQFQQPQFQQPQFQQQPQQFQIPKFEPQQFQQFQQQEVMSDNDSDRLPSRLKGPDNTFDTPDTIDLTNIMKKMDANKNINSIDDLLEETEKPSEKVIKQKPRGRPAAAKKKNTRGIVAV